MSYTRNVWSVQLTNNGLDYRTVAEIQRKVIRQRGQDPFTGIFHTKDDEEMVTTWKLGLNKILHVFNVG